MNRSRPVPRWVTWLLQSVAAEDGLDIIGDLEEAHCRRLQRQRPARARLLTTLEAIELIVALIRVRLSRQLTQGRDIVQDYKLGLRMLLKYPGLTLAGGLALAIAIGIGAAWYDVTTEILRPRLPFPDGDRIVSIEMRDTAAVGEERRLQHDYAVWARDARTLADLGAFRSVQRNLSVGDAPPEPITVAELTASAFRIVGVAPALGRPLTESDEEPGAPPVAVIGHSLWTQRFAARADVIGTTVQIGTIRATIVGVMPERFAFPVNHRLWTPLPLPMGDVAPLDGPDIEIVGQLAKHASQAEANAELAGLVARVATDSPTTHAHLRPRVLAYGGESPGDRSWLEFVVTHGPILMVLLVACTNVSTLIYARTATREAEMATRYALGAGRSRIVAQLFVEALVLAAAAAVFGLLAADRAVRWGTALYYSSQIDGPPFWVQPGLSPTTVAVAALLAVAGAVLLGVLPGLTVTQTPVHTQLRTLGVGGSTLRFGRFWTTAMVAQVALTVILLPPAAGISTEAVRDRQLRGAFPGEQFLAIRLGVDRARTGSADPMLVRHYREFERRLRAEPGVREVTFADRLPGMGPDVRSVEVEPGDATTPRVVEEMWLQAVGPRFFETFEIPFVAGRDFYDGERVPGSRTVMVNEAFARRYFSGRSPVGSRVRLAGDDPAAPEPWLEIVGMVRDIGMTPTDRGEAPYVFTPASVATSPLTVGVRLEGSPLPIAGRVRAIAADLDAGFRLEEVRTLDELTWRVDVPMMIGAGAIATAVSLGLFLSAGGIFALMAVSVARRTREIGLRTALGASRARLLASVFSHAALLVGSGVAAGNAVLLLFVGISEEVGVADVVDALLTTSAVMLGAGLLACIEPARRALRIQPTEALKEA